MTSKWWQSAVFYQIYPRSFADGNGDGVGDLPGILSKVDYLANLGVDAVWLSPFFTSPMKDFGYDVADYCDVDPLFGTLEDFDRLLAALHARDMKLIIDQVYSHTSDEHAWFQESRQSRDNPKADWYVWVDPQPDGSPPNNWLSVFGGSAWAWEPRRGQYYLHNFVVGQPDLNFHNPAVRDAVLDVARFWMERGVDGFRLDVANFYYHHTSLADNPPSGVTRFERLHELQEHKFDINQPETIAFHEDLRALVDGYGDRMLVAEIGDADAVRRTAEYTAGPKRLHTAYSFVFLQEAFSAGHIRAAVEELDRISAPMGGSWPSWSFSNHDVSRVASRWIGGDAPSPAAVGMLHTLLLTLRGTPFLYQGEELGLPDGEVPFDRIVDPDGLFYWPSKTGRDPCRTPFPWETDAPFAGFSTVEPWLPMDPRHAARAADSQAGDVASPLEGLRRLLAWRKSESVLIEGDITFQDTPEPVLGFTRSDGERTLHLVFNLSDTAQTVSLPAGRPVQEANATGRLVGDAIELPSWGWYIGRS